MAQRIQGRTVRLDDVQELVTYVPRHGNLEVGRISWFNESYVFVVYGDDTQGKATRGSDLMWGVHRREKQDDLP